MSAVVVICKNHLSARALELRGKKTNTKTVHKKWSRHKSTIILDAVYPVSKFCTRKHALWRHCECDRPAHDVRCKQNTRFSDDSTQQSGACEETYREWVVATFLAESAESSLAMSAPWDQSRDDDQWRQSARRMASVAEARRLQRKQQQSASVAVLGGRAVSSCCPRRAQLFVIERARDVT